MALQLCEENCRNIVEAFFNAFRFERAVMKKKASMSIPANHTLEMPNYQQVLGKESGSKLVSRRTPFLLIVDASLTSVFHSIRFLGRAVPPAILNRCFSASGSMVYWVFPGIRRRLVEKITDAIPELAGSHEVGRIARGACRSLLMPALDLVIMEKHQDRLMGSLKVEGLEHLESADARGRGVILAACHQGRNALRISVMAHIGKPYTPIYFHPDNTPVSHYYRAMLK